MKRFSILATIITVSVAIGYAQSGEVGISQFPPLLFVPYVLGVLVHWLKKYTMEGLNSNFLQWFITNIAWTIGSLVAGLTAVWAIFSTTPGAFVPTTIGSWIIVFTTAMAADTLNSGGSTVSQAKTKPNE